jgi:hypothetical protein
MPTISSAFHLPESLLNNMNLAIAAVAHQVRLALGANRRALQSSCRSATIWMITNRTFIHSGR